MAKARSRKIDAKVPAVYEDSGMAKVEGIAKNKRGPGTGYKAKWAVFAEKAKRLRKNGRGNTRGM